MSGATLYSLGITMFEMVTGHVPFEGDNTVTVALAHLEEPMPGSQNVESGCVPKSCEDHLKMYGKETGAPIPERGGRDQ